ncbi:MAG: dTMP kinase [Acidobacteria bacterium]|nr:dTMP kinase [Acidobacteriota bacterium]
MATGFFITFEGLDGSGKTTQLRRLAGRLAALTGGGPGGSSGGGLGGDSAGGLGGGLAGGLRGDSANGLQGNLAGGLGGDAGVGLALAGRGVTTLRQPGSTALGDRIRGVLLDSKTEAALGPIDPMAELTLMFADRAQAIAEVIRPAMARGEIVLCDRFTDSSEAYQGGGRELGSAAVLALDRAVCGGLKPDLTLLLLPKLEVALFRARRRNSRSASGAGATGGSTADEGRFERESDTFYRRIHAKYLEIAAREPGRVVTIAEDGGIASVEAKILAVVMERLGAAGAMTGAEAAAGAAAEARL